jgi:hypothetical protein
MTARLPVLTTVLLAVTVAASPARAASDPTMITRLGNGAYQAIGDGLGGETLAWGTASTISARSRVAADGAWGPTSRVAQGRKLELEALAIDGAHTIYALFASASTNGHTQLQIVQRPVGGTWSAPTTVVTSGGKAGYVQRSTARLTVSPAGRSTVVWCTQSTSWPMSNTESKLVAATRAPNGGWPEGVEIASLEFHGCDSTEANLEGPNLASAANGDVVASWTDAGSTAGTNRVVAVRRIGETWASPVKLWTGSDRRGSTTVFDATGLAHIFVSSSGLPLHKTLTAQGRPGSALFAGAPAPESAPAWPGRLALGVDGTLTPVALQRTRKGAIVSSSQRPDGSWSTARVVDPLRTGMPTDLLPISGDAAGNLVATWTSPGPPGIGADVFQSFRPSGGSWSPRALVARFKYQGNGFSSGAVPVTLSAGALTSGSVVTWNVNEHLYAIDAQAANRPRVTSTLRVPHLTGTGAVKRHAINLKCAVSARGSCTVKVLFSKAAARVLGAPSRRCVETEPVAGRVSPARHFTTVGLRVFHRQGRYDIQPACERAIRLLRQPGADLALTAVVTADAVGYASTEKLVRFTIHR